MTKINKIHENWKKFINSAALKEDKLPGGAADDMSNKEFDAEQLKIGTEHEMEHTVDRKKAEEIAKDHLLEDPNYYKKIKKIEMH